MSLATAARICLCLSILGVPGGPLAAAADEPLAAENVPTAAALASPTAEGPRIIPAGIELRLELVTALTTKTAKPGDAFELRTLDPVQVDGVVLIPAGSPAFGQVVHAQKAGAFGRPGEFILAVRRVEHGGRVLPMRAFRPQVGKDRTGASTGTAGVASGVTVVVPAVGVAMTIFSAFIRGGQIVLPPGTEVVAAVAHDTEFEPALATSDPTRSPTEQAPQ